MVVLPPDMLHLLEAGGVLLLTLVAGTVAHETTHMLVLRAVGVPFDVSWLPRDDDGDSGGFAIGTPLATVTPTTTREPASPVGIRLAAVAPLVLATPFVLVFAGLLPDPFGTDDAYVAAATVGWAACALPSPQDFACFWYGHRQPDRTTAP